METQSLGEFIKDVKKVKGPRKHKVTNSYNVYDYYRNYLKTKPKRDVYKIDSKTFYTIIRTINKFYGEQIMLGNDVKLPKGMGKIQLRKRPTKVSLDKKTQKLKTNLTINWHDTLKLWHEDEESKNKKILVRNKTDNLFKIFHNKSNVYFQNKRYYDFKINRSIKQGLKNNIREGLIDAFLIKPYNNKEDE